MAKLTRDKKIILEKLKETPSQKKFDLHYWADYIEIKCLFNTDNVFSKDDFLDCIKSNKDFSPKENLIDKDEEDYEEFNLNEKAYKNDKDERFADDCFKMIKSRITLFEEHYPFTISKNNRAIFKKKTFTWKNRCYIFLLLSSSLKYLRRHQSIFTSSFEIFSLNVLKALLPPKAEAHIFGSSNTILKKRRYKGHVWLKLNQLKNDLNEEHIKAKKEDFPPTDSGDSGFDFVAWVPNGDKQSHLMVFTGQAACTSEWYDKKYTSSPSALISLLPLSVPPINLVFIPFSVRIADGSWHRAHDIGQCVLLDRQRLLYHFDNSKSYYLSLPCDKIILELLKLKESAYN
ncbi:MAG TPA: hypothetical protein VKT28_11005 [Puia sp.]|nr:hypothetical protein [Puia sp.]